MERRTRQKKSESVNWVLREYLRIMDAREITIISATSLLFFMKMYYLPARMLYTCDDKSRQVYRTLNMRAHTRLLLTMRGEGWRQSNPSFRESTAINSGELRCSFRDIIQVLEEH